MSEEKLNKKENFVYPFSDHSKNIWNVPLKIRMLNKLKSQVTRVQKPLRNPEIKIQPIAGTNTAPLNTQDMPLIVLIHDDIKLLNAFLKHYRNLGVSRFICIDDISTDGSREFLLQQDDTSVFESNVRYSTAHRGKAWREMLADWFGKNRWYVNVDSDEFLLTGASKNTSLLQYAKQLQDRKIYRLPAPMIDMVPAGNISDAIIHDCDDRMPWEILTHFDGDGYTGHTFLNGINLRGGARLRLFDAVAELMKFPLIYWDDQTSMGVSIHSPKPGHRNFAPICGCLLHFKLFSDIKSVSKDAVADNQYYRDALEYHRMFEFFSQEQENDLLYSGSIEFTSKKLLIDRGFIRN